MSTKQVPEFMMSMLHQTMVHYVAQATFSSSSSNESSSGTAPQQQQKSTEQQQQTETNKSATAATSSRNENFDNPNKNAAAATPKHHHTPVPSILNATSGSPPPSLLCSKAEKATEFYHRLESLGFTIGLRIAERLLCSPQFLTPSISLADKPQEEAVNLIQTVLWPAVFGKEIGREVDPNQQQQSTSSASAAATSSSSQSQQQHHHSASGGYHHQHVVTKTPVTFRLVDSDFSWVRSVGLPWDGVSLADPYIRAPHADVLEEPAQFAAALMMNQQHQRSRSGGTNTAQQQQNFNKKQQSQSQQSLSAGPNDHVVVLIGIVLGFLSTLGFGSHTERRIFGGERYSIAANTPAMMEGGGGSNPTPRSNLAPVSSTTGGNPSTSTTMLQATMNPDLVASVIPRGPQYFVTVRHVLVSREQLQNNINKNPSGLQLRLVIRFS